MSNGDRWAIVGGGLLGMTMAHTLAKAGRRITLFESAGVAGGLASAWQIGDVTWDRYYHVTLYSDSVLRALLGELDLDEKMCWRKTQTGFYYQGHLYPFSNAVDFVRFPLLNPIEKVRLAATILYASRYRDWQRLESIPVAQWLSDLSGKGVFEKIWLPLLRAKLGDDYKDTSATFIWATIQRMYAARQSGLKEEQFGYLPGGYARMLEAYQTSLCKLGVEIRLGAEIAQVSSSGSSGTEVRLQSGDSSHFKRVIVTTPPPVASRLCADLTPSERQCLGDVPYIGIICASVLLRRPLSPYYITNILDAAVPFTGLIEMTALVNPVQFGDRFLVYLPRYVRPDHPDFQRSEEELSAGFRSSLKQMHPTLADEDFMAVRVSRSRYVFARPTPDCCRRLPPIDTSVPGLNIVTSAHIVNGTLNANETVGLAQREARRIHAQFN